MIKWLYLSYCITHIPIRVRMTFPNFLLINYWIPGLIELYHGTLSLLDMGGVLYANILRFLHLCSWVIFFCNFSFLIILSGLESRLDELHTVNCEDTRYLVLNSTKLLCFGTPLRVWWHLSRASSLVNRARWCESGHPESRRSATPLPTLLALCISSIGCSWVVSFYNEPII